jgi:hypothetical protein
MANNTLYRDKGSELRLGAVRCRIPPAVNRGGAV